MGLISQTEQAYYQGSSFGGYQFISIEDIINNFVATYVGEGKILQNVNRADVSFHAHRALAELSFDTFKSCKSQEITLPPSLQMVLPQDYVNYTKVSWIDTKGIKHLLYPTSKTSNPTSIQQHTEDDYANGIKEGDYKIDTSDIDGDGVSTDLLLKHESSVTQSTILDSDTTVILSTANSSIVPGMVVSGSGITVGTTVVAINGTAVTLSAAATATATNVLSYTLTTPTSNTWSNYNSDSLHADNNSDYQNDRHWREKGNRYGIDPQHAQSNGSFYIDCNNGKIHFSSNVAGKIIVLDYISDALGTDGEMQVHKLAEEAMYKWITYGCLTARAGVPEYVMNRFKKEKRAETRKAKIRLSNIKIEEITQVLRGRSKWIKH